MLFSSAFSKKHFPVGATWMAFASLVSHEIFFRVYGNIQSSLPHDYLRNQEENEMKSFIDGIGRFLKKILSLFGDERRSGVNALIFWPFHSQPLMVGRDETDDLQFFFEHLQFFGLNQGILVLSSSLYEISCNKTNFALSQVTESDSPSILTYQVQS